jgi:hypothetical protein
MKSVKRKVAVLALAGGTGADFGWPAVVVVLLDPEQHCGDT